MDSDAAVYSAGNIFVTTNLAAATATVATMIITWLRYRKPDISMTLNGSLAGLVAITAGCDMVSPAGAFFIGLIAAFVVVFGIEFIDKVCKIERSGSAIGVHGCDGAAGTLLTGRLCGGWRPCIRRRFLLPGNTAFRCCFRYPLGKRDHDYHLSCAEAYHWSQGQ